MLPHRNLFFFFADHSTWILQILILYVLRCLLGIEHLWDVFQSTVVKSSCESICSELLSVVQVRYSYYSSDSYTIICS